MKFLKLIIITLSISLMYGCATHKKSDALQIVNAAGIHDVRDTKIHGDAEVALTSSSTYQVAFNSMGTGVVTGNGLNMDSLSVGLAMTMLSPRSDAARHSMFGWVPSEKLGGQTSLEYFHFESRNSIGKSAQDLGYKLKTIIDGRSEEDNFASSLLTSYILENPNVGCPAFEEKNDQDWKKYCYFGLRSYKDLDEGPEDVNESLAQFSLETKSVYEFYAGKAYHYSRPYINRPATATFNDLDIYQEFSKHLPDYVFVYVAPKVASISQDEKLQFPILFRSGKPMFFVVSESEKE